MNSVKFSVFLVGLSLPLLTIHVWGVPTTSPVYDIRHNRNQVHWIDEENTPGHAVSETTRSAVTGHGGNDEGIPQMESTDADLHTTNNEHDLYTLGQKCVQVMTYVTVQTNLTFDFLCSQLDNSYGYDDGKMCKLLSNTDWSYLPSIQHMLASLHNKTVYTTLLAIYNMTFQYAGFVVNMSNVQCVNCGDNIQCENDQISQEEREYCRVAELRPEFIYLLDNLREMVEKLHGTVPVLHPIPYPTFDDITPAREFSIASLAVAVKELTEAKALLVTNVLNEL